MSREKKLMKSMDERSECLRANENPQQLRQFHLLCEIGEWMYNPISEEIEDVLMVPNFAEKEAA